MEDNPANIAALKKECRVICMAASYNHRTEGIEYAVDFGEIYQIIKDHKIRRLGYHDFIKLGKQEKEQYLCRLKDYYKGMPFDVDFKKKYERFILWIVKSVSWIIRYFFPFRIEGERYLRQPGAAIYICNHRSSLDIILCYCVLNWIPTRFLGKSDKKWYHFLQRRIGTIFVVRDDKRSGVSAKNTMLHTLLNGGNVFLFPEGTRNRTKKAMLPFRFGAVQMAQVTGCPIVPVVIRKRQGKFKVSIDKPVYISKEDDVKIENEKIRERMCRIYRQR